jgi:ATP-dependent Clp protease ATP-binding subunit ClpA
MWQRFTERARKVVFYAQEEAGRLGENYVSTEHLLLGLVRENDSLAAQILDRLGVSLVRIRSEVERQVTRGDGRLGSDMQLMPRAKRVVDLAYDEARQLNNNYIGTEHLLLGMIREGEGLAGRILNKLGLDLDRVRREVLVLQEGSDREKGDSDGSTYTTFATHSQLLRDVMSLLKRAEVEATLLDRSSAGLEHLLLALMADEKSVAARMLLRQGATLEGMRAALKEIHASDSGQEGGEPPGA